MLSILFENWVCCFPTFEIHKVSSSSPSINEKLDDGILEWLDHIFGYPNTVFITFIVVEIKIAYITIFIMNIGYFRHDLNVCVCVL